jgi:predicted dehydrogenase
MIEPLHIGIVGCGGIMRSMHMPGWALVPGARVVAICDTNRAVAEAFALDFGIDPSRVFTDHRDLLQLEDLHAVDVATPNRFHTPVVLEALGRGLHVICEKPLAVSTVEVRALADAAKAANRLLMTAQHMRFTAMTRALRGFVNSGALGEVYHARVHAVRRNWLPTAPTFIDATLSGGGPCMDIGVHALDTAMHLMDFPNPVRVTGVTRTNFAKGHAIPGGWGEWDRERFCVEDHASGFVHFDNGATLVLEASWLQHQIELEDFSAQLYGKNAGVKWPTGEYASVVGGALVDGKINALTGLHAAHSEEILAFADAIRHGKPSPVPVEQTLKVISILEAIVESGKTGREVVLSSERVVPATLEAVS